MSTSYFKGSAHSFKRLMQLAAEDIATGGEVKAAKVLHKSANPAKTHIGWFRRRLLLGFSRRRA